MSIRFALAAVAVCCILLPVAAHAGEAARPATKDEAQKAAAGAIADLAGKLKDYLGTALKEQGPVGAVGACNTIAPGAEAATGEAHKLKIKRTSLKVRNPANAPDVFEARVLDAFAGKAAAGEDVATLSHGEVVEAAGVRQFRFMKAIPMAEQPCANCHGGNLKPEVAARIRELYPDDQATGFKPGEIRGAFSVTVELQ